MNYKALWEAIKEGLRWLACMVAAYVVDLLISVIPGMSSTLSQLLNVDPILVTGVLTFILRGIDKYIHERNKEADSKVAFTNGLLPF